MSVFSKIKEWFTGGSSKKSSTRRARSVSNYGGGGSRSVRDNYGASVSRARQNREDEEKRRRQEAARKQKATTEKLSQISKRTDALSSGKPSATHSVAEIKQTQDGRTRALAKIAERSKNAPPDPKKAQREKSQKDATKMLASIDDKARNAEKKLNSLDEKVRDKAKKDRREFNKATGDRYNVEKNGLKARQAQKSQAYDVEAEKHEIAKHPIAASAARGALSGVTFGGSELVAQNSKKRKESGAEEFYQKNKSRGAEIGGEIVGSLAGFGATGGISKAAVGKLGGKAVGEKLTSKLATNSRVLRAAEKELQLAIDRGAVNVTSEAMRDQLIKQFAKNRASRIVGAVGEDAAINLTTGLASDINHAVLDSDNPEEFAKNMGINAGANLLMGGATAFAPALRTQKGVINRRLRDETLDAIRNANMSEAMRETFVKHADDARRIDLNDLLAKRLEKESTDALAPVTTASRAARAEEAQTAVRQVADEVRAQEVAPEIRPAEVVPEVRPQTVDNAVTPPPVRNVAEATPDVGARASKLIDDENARIDRLRQLQWEINSTRGDERARLKEARRFMENDRASEIVATQEERAELIRQREALADALNNESDAIRREELGLQIETIDNILKREPKAELPRVDENGFPYEGTPEAEEMMRGSARRNETDPSQFAQVDEGMAGVSAEAEQQAKKVMPQTQEEKLATKIEEKATGRKMTNEEVEARRANQARLKQKEQKIKPRKMPKGEKLTSKVAKKIEGASFEEATKPASAKDIIEGERRYVRGQASKQKEVLSRGGNALLSATGNKAEVDVITKKMDDGTLNYARTKNKEKYEWAVREFVNNKEAVTKKMLEYADDIDSIQPSQMLDTHYQAHAVMKMMRGQLDNPNLTDAEKEAAREIYGAAASVTQQLSSLSGQINQFQGVMVHCDGKTRMRNAVDNIANMLDNSRGFRRSKTGKGLSGNVFQRKNQIRDLIYDDPDARKALEKIIDAATEEEYGDAMQELLYATSKMNRKHALDYVQTWRYLAMLGNPKTHARNVIGNITFGGIRQLSNTNRSVAEKLLKNYAESHGLEIERHGKASLTAFAEARTDNPASEAGKAAKEWFDKNTDKILGITKYDENISKGSDPAFMKWLTAISDKNAAALTGEDNFFRKRSYKESFIKSYNQYKKDGKEITEDLLEKIHQSALKESQVATFNEFNSMAQVLNKWSHPNYNASLVRKALGWGVNATMPFTKVPANILNQTVNYSPAGVLRGIANIRTAAATGDSAVFNKALDELSSGLTGTGIAALGFFLGKNTDWFTTNAGKEDAAAKFKKAQGVQNYSVTFKDPMSGETYSWTLDWLVPTSPTFFAGVEAANQMKRGYGDLFEFIGNMEQVTSRVIEPVLETSMLSGLYNIVEGMRSTSGDDDKQSALSLTIRELTQSYINSLVPTVQGQIARTAYGTDKQIAGSNDREYWVNSLKNKMGLANTNIGTEALGADTTAYGDVKGKKETTSDYVKSGLKNFLSPANIQKVDLSELDKQKIKQYEDAVKAGADPQEMAYLFPKKQYKKQFNVGDMDVQMSNKDLSTYNQAKTTGGDEGARIALESIMFNRYTQDAKGKKTPTKEAYTPEQKQKLIKQFEGKSIREFEKWLYDQPQFKNATEAEQKRVINQLWSLTGQGKSVGAKRVGEQAVIEAQGGDVNEYNFNNEISEKKRAALQPYVDAGVISYEDAVDFARYAGKTYYYENDEGGSSQTYYNKKQMYEYLKSKGYDDETAAALFNSFKASNAKEYGSSGYRRYGRRGYRRWHSWGHGGSSAKATVPKPKAIKANAFVKGEALTSKKSSSSKKKANLPKLKRVEAKIDLPTPRK